MAAHNVVIVFVNHIEDVPGGRIRSDEFLNQLQAFSAAVVLLSAPLNGVNKGPDHAAGGAHCAVFCSDFQRNVAQFMALVGVRALHVLRIVTQRDSFFMCGYGSNGRVIPLLQCLKWGASERKQADRV